MTKPIEELPTECPIVCQPSCSLLLPNTSYAILPMDILEVLAMCFSLTPSAHTSLSHSEDAELMSRLSCHLYTS